MVRVLKNTKIKKFGEVTTPNFLISDMLNTLPNELWSNPNLKWLDPCVGKGGFVFELVDRLMNGLLNYQPNEFLRKKYILEKMLYVCEIQEASLNEFLSANSNYDVNYYLGSYLDESFDEYMLKIYNIKKFDIIIMNPPYNTSSNSSGSAHTLWDKFVQKVINISLENGGYLVAVHPSGWRNIDGGFKKIQNLLKNKKIEYLEIHDQKDGINAFGAETRYDFYCLNNVNNNLDFKTKIRFQDNSVEYINLVNLEFIPNCDFNIINVLIGKDHEVKIHFLKNSSYHTQKKWVSKVENDEYKYPLISFISKNNTPTLYYSSINNEGHFGIAKFIISNGRIKSVGGVLDITGKYGMTEFAFAIVDEIDVLEKIQKVFDGDNFKELMNACAINDSYYNWRMIKAFKRDFWKYFIG